MRLLGKSMEVSMLGVIALMPLVLGQHLYLLDSIEESSSAPDSSESLMYSEDDAHFSNLTGASKLLERPGWNQALQIGLQPKEYAARDRISCLKIIKSEYYGKGKYFENSSDQVSFVEVEVDGVNTSVPVPSSKKNLTVNPMRNGQKFDGMKYDKVNNDKTKNPLIVTWRRKSQRKLLL